jgi:RNA polymerase sigma-70 factor, ECF subfamily
MELEIDRLIKLMKKKKPEALERIMDLYMGSVYGVAKSILSNTASEGDIEECVQDVFIEAWNSIEKYDSERGSFKTWLLILCKYRALTLRKALANRGKVINIEDVQVPVKENIEDDYVAKESTEEIIAAINSLGDKDKELFLRRYILGQNVDEICLKMNLTRQAVDNRLWRGRKRLKGLFSLSEGGVINE